MSDANAAFRKLLEYEQRSQALDADEGEGALRSGEWAGVVFRIGNSRLACSVAKVGEFLPVPNLTRVPGTQPWILGLANLRGELLTVVDLAWFLSEERTPITVRTRVLAATLRGRPVGLLVDEVFGRRHFVERDARPPELPDSSPLAAFVSKQYRSGKDSWHELDIDRLFGSVTFLNGAAA